MAIANSDGSIIITTKLDVTPVSKALNALKSKFASLKEQRSAIQALTNAIKDQQFAIKGLEKEYALLVSQGKGNTENAKELKERIAELKAELQQLTGAANAMGVTTAAASTKAAQGLKQFGKRIAGIVKSALIFSVLYRVMQAVVKLFGSILMSDEEFRQDWEELKAAFYTAAYPIINLIVPAIKWIVQQVRDWAVSIGKVAAALQGMTYSELVEQAEASKKAADNYADMEKSSKKTADNVKKQLASFDDIEVLSSGDENEDKTNYFDKLKEYDTSGEKGLLADLMDAIGGALMAVGLILLYKGQIPWGIGFIIAGAATEAISFFATSDFDGSEVEKVIYKILGIAGTALLAIGLILLTFGVINQYSIGMIFLGAVSLASAMAMNKGALSDEVAMTIGVIMSIVSGAVLAIGVILLCMGVITPLTIGMVLSGAAGLWSGLELTGAWDAIIDAVASVASAISNIFSALWSGIVNGFKAMVNGIVSALNFLIDGLNVLTTPLRGIGFGISKLFGSDVSWDDFRIPHIPHLAKGAVIPPNKEFLAVLGDQTSGTNIETPLSTMVQAFKTALVDMGMAGNAAQKVVIEVDGTEFGRMVLEQGQREQRRVGASLVVS